jgi:hypothetical protein
MLSIKRQKVVWAWYLEVLVTVLVAMDIIAVIRVMGLVITSVPLKWQWSNGIGRADVDFVMEEVLVVITRAEGGGAYSAF